MKNVMGYFMKMLLFLLVFFLQGYNPVVTDQLYGNSISKREGNGKPRLSFEEEAYDFGKIYTGEKVEHRFRFKNTGSGKLVISKVETTCGCTAALASKNILQKDEEGEIVATYRAGLSGGKVKKAITIYSNDPDKPRFTLIIGGIVLEEVSVKPTHLNFGIIKMEERSTRKIIIRTVPEKKIEILKVESLDPYIEVDRVNDIDDLTCFQVTLTGGIFPGRVRGIISVYTTSEKYKRIDIPFYAEVVGDITFYPEVVHFDGTTNGKGLKRTVIINFINTNVKIEKIEAFPGVIKYRVTDLNNASKKIDITLEGNQPVERIDGNLKIYTSSPIQPVIIIPVKGKLF